MTGLNGRAQIIEDQVRGKKKKNQQNPPNSQPLVLQLIGNYPLFVRAVRVPAMTTRDGQCGDQAIGLVSGQDN